jgi:MFS family permease
MKQSWLNSTIPIAAIFSFRMLGLFMLIPVFTIHAGHLIAATPKLLGIALGGYGLSQGILQIPFGVLSDRYGRKPMLTLGLLLFAAGSLLGAWTESIYGMILARILQGAGAIGSVLIALLADVTDDTERTKAMAVIGITIGVSFSLAMVISPIIAQHFGLAGVFYLTAILAFLGLLLLYTVIPFPEKQPFQLDAPNATQFKHVFFNPHLLRLNIGIFCLHWIFTATFFVVPMLLQHQLRLGHLSEQWHFYLPILLCAFLTMIPLIIFAEKKRQIKWVFLSSIALICLAQWLLASSHQVWFSICGSMFIFFVAFNILEACLPSLISRHANAQKKGTAMGFYSSSQFLGIFMGGSLAGVVYQFFGSQGIFLMNGLVALCWLLIALPMQPYQYQLTLSIAYHAKTINEAQLMQQLQTLPGIVEVTISSTTQKVYVRVDKMYYKDGSAEDLISNFHL